ncbi:MAG: hypothetical protein IPJ66_13245 [Bacteroidetes bacterium]|nr:hypothetical protein [Bacteroidota bacterium]MBL0064173.1 hypothetical protein [Bacteroidota bacterium]
MKGISLLMGVLIGSMQVNSQTPAGRRPLQTSLTPTVMVNFIKPVGSVRQVNNQKKKPAHVQKTRSVQKQK